jgi:hypothetical protein
VWSVQDGTGGLTGKEQHHMKRIEFGGAEILMDEDATRTYRDKYCNTCDCAYCRNFLKTFREFAPEAVRFLEQFDIEPDAPIEIMEYGRDESKSSLYSVYYAVKGELPVDSLEAKVDDLAVLLYRRDSRIDYSNTDMPNPCFILRMELLRLPWVLDESYE